MGVMKIKLGVMEIKLGGYEDDTGGIEIKEGDEDDGEMEGGANGDNRGRKWGKRG